MKEQLLYAMPVFGDPEREAVKRVLETTWLSGGEQTTRFEQELAEWWGVKYAVPCNSGSSANFIALQALGLPKGSEIITPAGGAFPTTISPMVYLDHRPVFVDVDLDTLCINLDDWKPTIETRAVVFAHTLGQMPDMERLMAKAEQHGLKVLEDCCDAMGSEQNGKRAGTFGDIATVSFYPAHLMTTGGEGGAVLTNDKKLYLTARSIRDWGRACYCQWGEPQPACKDRFKNLPFDHRYYYTNVGMNLKLTEMQAAFGREQLIKADEFIRLRKRNYNILADNLGTQEVTEIVPFAYPIIHPERDRIVTELEERGIQTRALFSGNILEHPGYRDIPHRVVGELRNSQVMLEQAFFVGVGPHLTEENMEYIGKQLKEIL